MVHRQQGQLDPRGQVHGQHRHVDPRLVRGERPVGQLAQARGLQGLDPVLTPAPGPVAGVEEGDVVAWRVRKERGDAIAVCVEQQVLRSSVHEAVSFSVHEVTRFHTKSPERAYHFALFGRWL